jgi:DNA-binding response OmpR family regulator
MVRRHSPEVAIVAVLPGRDVTEIVAVLEAGADDCVGRPFSRAELGARLQAVSRRAVLTAASPNRPIGGEA